MGIHLFAIVLCSSMFHISALRVGGMSTAQVQQVSKVVLGDPSEFRPEHRDPDAFRDFRVHNVADRVIKTYDLMHTNQTVEFVRVSRSKYEVVFVC